MSDMKVAVIGAGPAGLAAALGLARRGHQVVVLERDAAQAPDDPRIAFDSWRHPGVPHFRLPHSLLGRARRALRENAPDVLDAMLRAGAWENHMGRRLVRDAVRNGDEDLVAVHCRRPFFECALRRAAEAEPHITIFTNANVRGVFFRNDHAVPPRVSGVEANDSRLDTDILVDAGGRNSPIRSLVQARGASMPHEYVEPCGVIYYSRYYCLVEGNDYPAWSGALGPGGTTDSVRFSVFFGDNATFAIVLGVLGSIRAFRALAQEDVFTRVISRFGVLRAFIEPGVSRPITGVVAMGALHNVFHPLLQDGRPPALGVHFVGDSYCHTNPLFAWGLCLALDYGFRLSQIIDKYQLDVEAQALAFAGETAVEAEQCFRVVAEEDHDRTLTWNGSPPSGEWLNQTFAGFIRNYASPAMMFDSNVARAVLRRSQLLDLPNDLMKQEAIIQRIAALQPELSSSPKSQVPSRDELLELMGNSDTPTRS